MQNITIGEIGEIIIYISGLIIAIETIVFRVSKKLTNKIKEETKEMNIKINDMDIRLKHEELNSMRAEIMRLLSVADRGGALTEYEKTHLYSLKDKYNKAGGDSYVDAYFERLGKEGKI